MSIFSNLIETSITFIDWFNNCYSEFWVIVLPNLWIISLWRV